MSGTDKHQICDRRFAFSGTIVANLSHEMNNVLAIVTEMAGLIDDSLLAAERGSAIKPEQLRQTVKRIGGQLKRGAGYVQQLNRFAHCADHSDVQVDARDIIEEITTLCQRFARLRRLQLDRELPAQPIHLKGCPFDLLHQVYSCIDIALEMSADRHTVTVSVEAAGDGARFVVRGDSAVGADGFPAPKVALAATLAGHFGCVLETAADAKDGFRLALTVPGTFSPQLEVERRRTE